MKFAKLLREHALFYAEVIPVDKYVDYSLLKNMIYHDKAHFFATWDVELNKVYHYMVEKTTPKELCSCTGGHTISCTLVFHSHQHLSLLEAEALQAYASMNREGFRKILKKFDKNHATLELSPRMDLVDLWLKAPVSELDLLVASTLPQVHSSRQPTLSFKTVAGLAVSVLAVLVFALVLAFAIVPTRIETLLYVGIPCAFVLAFANGANDIANSMGTTVGAGVLTLRNAILIGSAAEFVGAITMGSFVSKSISKGLIDTDSFQSEPDLFAMGMLCVLCGAGSTTLVATMYGFPISATHGIIGGLVSIGLIAKGTDAVSWSTLLETSLGWVLSPVAGMAVAFLLQSFLQLTIHRSANPVARSNALQPLFMTLSVGVSLLFILIKGPHAVQVKPVWLAVLVALAAGAVCAVIIHIWNRFMAGRSHGNTESSTPVVTESGSNPKDPQYPVAKESPLTLDNAPSTDRLSAQENGQAGEQSNPMFPIQVMNPLSEIKVIDDMPEGSFAKVISLSSISPMASDLGSAPGSRGTVEMTAPQAVTFAEIPPETRVHKPGNHSDSEDEGNETSSKLGEIAEQERPFSLLLVVSAVAVALAHGANDVGNSVGPLALIVEVYRHDSLKETPEIPLWCLFLGAVGFLLGILLIGSNTISTVGSKITKLTPSKSFATQIGAAVAVLTSSVVGMPVSTSHCLVGAVVGIGMAQKLTSTEASSLNLKVLNRIVIGWVVTIPLAMIVTSLLYWALESSFD